MRVTKRIELDYGHTLPNHLGFCNQLHGHHGIVEATVEGNLVMLYTDPSYGMVLDFGDLKKIMMESIHAKLDHGFAVWKKDTRPVTVRVAEAGAGEDKGIVAVSTLQFVTARNTKVLVTDLPPTAEFFARWCYLQIVCELADPLVLSKVTFYETPSSWSSYRYEDWVEEGKPSKLGVSG
jgi:6-pyruvoyltetrahydropterin/6-carboxytetrahydropterin synthase